MSNTIYATVFEVQAWRERPSDLGEGVSRRSIEAGISKNSERPNGGKNHKDPEKESINHHGNILPVLP